jgi:hypothetical protein
VNAGGRRSARLTRAERGDPRSEFGTRGARERDDKYLVGRRSAVEDMGNTPLDRRALPGTRSGDQAYLRRGVLGSLPLLLLGLRYLRWVNGHGLLRYGSSSAPPSGERFEAHPAQRTDSWVIPG